MTGVRLPIFRLVIRSLNVVWAEKKTDTNAETDRANRGHASAMHSSKPGLPSFSLYSKVLMSITLLRFKSQNATKFGKYLRFSIFCLCLLKISRRRREVQWQNWGDFHKKANILAIPANLPLKFPKTVMVIFKMYKRHIFWSREENIRLFQAFRYKSAGEKFTRKKRTIDDLRRKSVNHSGVVHFRGCPYG